MLRFILTFTAIALFCSVSFASDFEEDVIQTSAGDLRVTFIGHGTLMLRFGGKVIHVDPWSALADYSELPRADLVLLTHHHIDHLDSLALFLLRRNDTVTIGTVECADRVHGVTVLRNGEETKALGLRIEAVPAYNSVRPDRRPVHPKGQSNGYIVIFGDKRVYFAAETENIPELARIMAVDVAFVAMDGVYNMTPEEAAEAVRVFQPKVVYPVHFGTADVSQFSRALKGSGIEVRVRKMR